MVLTEKEKNIVEYLRNPILSIMRKDIQMSSEPLSTLSNNGVLELYNKMDSYIDEEGKFRASLGLYDEMYVLELSSVKDKLKTEYEKRMNGGNMMNVAEEITPNELKMTNGKEESFVVTDLKGEICSLSSDILKKHGYNLKTFKID